MNTLESGIDIGQEINVGLGKFGQKNKHRAWKIWQKFEIFVMKKNGEKNIFPIFYTKFNKRRAYVYSGV